MPTLVSKLTEVQAALNALAKQHKVPGASLGILSGKEYIECVTGVTNVDTQQPVTSDTHFQIGSNTKVMVATLFMKLQEEGKLDLDDAVTKHVPEFTLADTTYLRQITLRQLLTHTNGIDAADYFIDTGEGADAIEKFVASLDQCGQIYPPGEMWSYCNAGTVLCGRVIEKVTGLPFVQAFHAQLLEPLKLKQTTMRIPDMLVRSTAVGHITKPGDDRPSVTPQPLLPASTAPAGAFTSATSRDMVKFAKLHIDGGGDYLSKDSIRAMQQTQAKLPGTSTGESMGVGWMLSEFSGERVLAHGGGTVGQLSFYYVLPDRPFVFVLLTNGSPGGGALFADIGKYVFEEFAGVSMPEPTKVPDVPPKIKLEPYAGLYRRRDIDLEITLEGGKLMAKSTYTGQIAGLDVGPPIAITPIDRELFAMGEGRLEFMDFDKQGRPNYVHSGRVARRVAAGTEASAAPRKKAASRAKKAPARKKSGARKQSGR
jgi:CubicO group peptidase (beta-lactamase class C family)